MRLKDDYNIANCCKPVSDDKIVGYFSHNNIIKVHKQECANLDKAERARLVSLEWIDIVAGEDFQPGEDYQELDPIDFSVLAHHQNYGFDYSLRVAAMLHLDKQSVFERHGKLRQMGLLERVEPRMIQYRKNIVKGKWIKHRNHTYYDLTEKGNNYLEFFLGKKENQ